jgi:hypothetical protein
VADASFFSGIVEGSGFAVGEAVFVVVLVAVAVGFGMTRDSLLEYIGAKIHAFFRKKKAASENPQSEWRLPSWVRVAVWLLVTGLSGFLAWKAVPTAIERKADQLPTSSAGLPPGAVWNNEGNFAVTMLPQNIPGPASGQTASNHSPEYLKDIAFGIDDGTKSTMMGAESAITADRLRVFVDYSLYRNGWVQRTRATIGVIKEPIKGQYVSLPLISTGRFVNTGSNDLWWGGPLSASFPIPPPDLSDLLPAIPVRARLVVIGPSDEEQHYYFMLIRVAAQPGERRFGIVRPPETDWIDEWEREK